MLKHGHTGSTRSRVIGKNERIPNLWKRVIPQIIWHTWSTGSSVIEKMSACQVYGRGCNLLKMAHRLRSGHCKLLNSYKKKLKQADSSSCPGCGMDPQDVPQLFNCTAHPTALTPEHLWDRPVKTIRELSFLDPENVD